MLRNSKADEYILRILDHGSSEDSPDALIQELGASPALQKEVADQIFIDTLLRYTQGSIRPSESLLENIYSGIEQSEAEPEKAYVPEHNEAELAEEIHRIGLSVLANLDFEEEPLYEEETVLKRRLFRKSFFQRTGWWVTSIALHAACIFLAALWFVFIPEKLRDESMVTMDFQAIPGKGDPATWKMGIRVPDVTYRVQPGSLEKPDLFKEDILYYETPENIEQKHKSIQLTEIIGSKDFQGVDWVPEIEFFNAPPAFQHRTLTNKKKAIARFGGSQKTEGAVLRALDWFKRHQSADGSWSMDHYAQECKDAPLCESLHVKASDPWSEKNCATGLALLCFLGAGHTKNHGKYRQQVADGIAFLEANQAKDGSLGRNGYCNAIAAMALAEAYGMTKSPSIKESAQKVINNILARQNPGLAWNYGGPSPRNDTSVTGWQVMALKAAHSSGLDIGNSFEGIRDFFSKVTPDFQDKPVPMLDGNVAYTFNSQTGKAGGRNRRLTAIGCLSRVFIGEDTKGKMLQAHANSILTKPPEPGNSMDFYRWYYATLAMFQMGDTSWKQWNKGLKESLCPTQQKGGCEDGSWDPSAVTFGLKGGRLLSTALGCLSLEVYYRYTRVNQPNKQ
jgi:hypothetical protein